MYEHFTIIVYAHSNVLSVNFPIAILYIACVDCKHKVLSHTTTCGGIVLTLAVILACMDERAQQLWVGQTR